MTENLDVGKYLMTIGGADLKSNQEELKAE